MDAAVRHGVRSTFTREGYLAAVARVREYILAGDIFQANLSQRFEAQVREPAPALYQRLRRVNPAPFAAYLAFDDVELLSASPERFLRLEPVTRGVETRPIKGTRPRGTGPMHDAALGLALAESEKDRAENVMIVDLLRNDLSRVCRPGTVRAPELFALEHHPTVHHLVSTVTGILDQGRDRRRPAARHLSGRLDHRGAEGARDGDHRRAGAHPPGAPTAAPSAISGSTARSTPASSSGATSSAGASPTFRLAAASSRTPTRRRSIRRRSTRPWA